MKTVAARAAGERRVEKSESSPWQWSSPSLSRKMRREEMVVVMMVVVVVVVVTMVMRRKMVELT